MSGQPVWFFYHVPKTGGQSIRNHLRAQLGATRHVHLGRWVPQDPKPADPIELIAASAVADIAAITGHAVERSLAPLFDGRPIAEMAALREPAARMVSLYNYTMWRRSLRGDPPIPFDDFLLSRPVSATEFLARRLELKLSPITLDKLLYELSKFQLVTTMDHLDDDLELTFSALGLEDVRPGRANESGVHFERLVTVDSVDVDRIHELYADDVALYACAEELRALTLPGVHHLLPRNEG